MTLNNVNILYITKSHTVPENPWSASYIQRTYKGSQYYIEKINSDWLNWFNCLRHEFRSSTEDSSYISLGEMDKKDRVEALTQEEKKKGWWILIAAIVALLILLTATTCFFVFVYYDV